MSFTRGDCKRTRAQSHQNKTKFKNDLHDTSARIKQLNAMSINEVCQKCHDVIQWKIKYRKYKALTAPGSCTYCHEKKVKKAYHVICRDCSIAHKKCAKCLKCDSEVEIIPPEPTPEEKLRMDVEMKALIKSLSERKRRTFLRFMNGKKKRKNKADDDQEEEEKEVDDTPKYRTREELLQKIEKLKGTGDDFYDGISISDGDDDDEWESGSENSLSADEADT